MAEYQFDFSDETYARVVNSENALFQLAVRPVKLANSNQWKVYIRQSGVQDQICCTIGFTYFELDMFILLLGEILEEIEEGKWDSLQIPNSPVTTFEGLGTWCHPSIGVNIQLKRKEPGVDGHFAVYFAKNRGSNGEEHFGGISQYDANALMIIGHSQVKELVNVLNQILHRQLPYW